MDRGTKLSCNDARILITVGPEYFFALLVQLDRTPPS